MSLYSRFCGLETTKTLSGAGRTMTLLFKVLRRFFNAGRRNNKQRRLNTIQGESVRIFEKINVLRTVKRIFSATKSFLTLVRRKFFGEKGKDRSFGEPMNEQQWALFRDDRRFPNSRKGICSRLNLSQNPIPAEFRRQQKAIPYPYTKHNPALYDGFCDQEGRQRHVFISKRRHWFSIAGDREFKTRMRSVFRGTNIKTVVGYKESAQRFSTDCIRVPSPTVKRSKHECAPFSEVPTSKSLPSSVAGIPGKFRSVFGFSEAVVSVRTTETNAFRMHSATCGGSIFSRYISQTIETSPLRRYLSALTFVSRQIGHFATFQQPHLKPSTALCAVSQ